MIFNLMEQTNTLDVRRVAKAGDSVCRAITSYRDVPCCIASSQRVVLHCSVLRCVCNTLRWVGRCGIVDGAGARYRGRAPCGLRPGDWRSLRRGQSGLAAASASGLRTPHLPRDCARPGHICARTGLVHAKSAPALCLPRPYLRRDCTHGCPTSASGLGSPQTDSEPCPESSRARRARRRCWRRARTLFCRSSLTCRSPTGAAPRPAASGWISADGIAWQYCGTLVSCSLPTVTVRVVPAASGRGFHKPEADDWKTGTIPGLRSWLAQLPVARDPVVTSVSRRGRFGRPEHPKPVWGKSTGQPPSGSTVVGCRFRYARAGGLLAWPPVRYWARWRAREHHLRLPGWVSLCRC